MATETWVRKNRKFAPEVAKERVAEQSRRYAIASYRASSVLAKRYPEEYQELLSNERTILDTERGPLPGEG